MEGDGFAPQALRSVRQWAQQFDVPLLQLTPIDTIKQLVLNPTQLTTVKAAQALAARDRLGAARRWTSPSSSSTSRARWTPRGRWWSGSGPPTRGKLGLDGTRQAIEDARATLKRLEDAEAAARDAGAAGEGRRRHAHLGSRRASTRRGGRTTPSPGRCSSSRPSPRRRSARRSSARSASTASSRRSTTPSWPGTTCRPVCCPGRIRAPSGCARRGRPSGFPRSRTGPSSWSSWVRWTWRSAATARSAARTRRWCRGSPRTRRSTASRRMVRTSRTAEGSAIAAIDVSAVIDHVRPDRVRDSASARLRGVKLPNLTVPGLPFTLRPGTGGRRPQFRAAERAALRPVVHRLEPGRLGARQRPGGSSTTWNRSSGGWSPGSRSCRWTPGSAVGCSRPSSRCRATSTAPSPQRLEAVIGEEVAKAEKMVRAKVDSVGGARRSSR